MWYYYKGSKDKYKNFTTRNEWQGRSDGDISTKPTSTYMYM